ncbi:MAG: efflux RND transporter periplasmic adaptor subunit [Zoogloeaceae bacterium]|jgi:membrane fusion protein (multidrug efflux system)|nr:efflux RND transporter periplasmic adaptor subunit [Zoogloeaceae bacterium]
MVKQHRFRALLLALAGLAVLASVARIALRTPGPGETVAARETAAETQGQSFPGAPDMKPVTVETAAVQTETFLDETTAIGTVKSNESVVLKPEISGRIAGIHFRDGGAVRTGALLVRLEASIEAAELRQAEANLSLARANLRRNEDLFQKKFVSQAMLDNSRAALQVEAAKVALAAAQYKRTRIHAPFGGVVGLRNVSVGDYVREGEALINLEDTKILKVDFRLPEMHLNRLRGGLPLEVVSDALPGETRQAVLTAIDPLVDAEGRAISCRAALPNPDGRLSPGMFVRVRLRFGAREVRTIPEEAVISGVNPQVFRIEGGVARAVGVRLGQRQGNRVEVLEGLDPGNTIVTAGQMKLKDGARVTMNDTDAGLVDQGIGNP